MNNCGPASLAMYLDFFGWEGTQITISDLIKPVPEDRNVNVEELVYYVRTQAGWLNAEYRVGGNLTLLKQFLAAGIPVMIEESFRFEDPFWPNDDLWAAHYLLLTGYDDSRGVFTTQDSFHGPDQVVEYKTLDKEWQIFNRVYILVYPPAWQAAVQSILGPDWDVEANRQRALETARSETTADAGNAYAWFNLGSNLVYFGRYEEAAAAYDQARNLSLPQRMLRYQFGPFFAYFHAGRTEDLLALTEYALQRTPNAEEALLWNGWALYRTGDTNQAIAQFQKALEANPYYQDARYALDFVVAGP
jgi:tetratricopeptide (TPR) repeat protein